MKYIDAEKLKTWLGNEADMEFKKTEENANSPVLCHFHNGCRMQALDTIDFIESLQQEQPVPCWIHANYSDKPEIRYTPSGTPYLQNGPHMIWLSDLERLPKDGTDLTNPIQEQPDVDLEKEIDEMWKRDHSTLKTKEQYSRPARHFYELGQRAMRKRIVDPEYNRDVIEKMKTEYPVDESNARKE